MQATVMSADPQTGSLIVARDDGLAYDVPAEVVAASGLRFVRAGQRLTVVVDGTRVTSVRIVGIGPGEQIR